MNFKPFEKFCLTNLKILQKTMLDEFQMISEDFFAKYIFSSSENGV